MNNLDKDILKILSTASFEKITNNYVIKITKLNATISLLIKNDIPFTLDFSPGTRRVSSKAELTVFINPTTQIIFKIVLDNNGVTDTV